VVNISRGRASERFKKKKREEGQERKSGTLKKNESPSGGNNGQNKCLWWKKGGVVKRVKKKGRDQYSLQKIGKKSGAYEKRRRTRGGREVGTESRDAEGGQRDGAGKMERGGGLAAK